MSTKEIYLKELNEQGKTLFSCDKYAEAIKKYEQAITEDSMYLPTYFNACEAFIMADMFEEAKKMMKRVLMIDKENGEAYFHLGNIALLEEDYEEGKIQYAKSINCGNDIPQIYINLASVAEENDEWEEAISYYTKAIVRDRTCYSAKIRKTQIYFMLNKYAEALNSADDLIETNPEIFEGHHLKFIILATANKLDEASQALDKAQRLFPDDQGFVLDRVKLLELKGDYENALELLKTLDGSVVPEEVISTEKAKLLLALGRNEEAKSLLEGYTGDVVMPEMQKVLITIYIEEKNHNGILKAADKILALEEYDSNYFSALYFKAYATKLSGDLTKAEIAYKEAAKIMQQACSINSGVLDLYIYRAICYRELKEYDKANEMLDYIAAVDENIAEIYYIRHLIYADLNDDRAAGELEKAKSMNPEVASIFGE